MKIAVMQQHARPCDVAYNLETLRREARAARAEGAELLTTPELFVSGYAPAALAEWLTPERVTEIPQAVASIARDEGIAIAASFPRHVGNGQFTIAAGLWDATGGSILQYDKVHLWGAEEALAFVPAEEAPATAIWNGLRVGFQICYDIEFPEPARFLARSGAQLLLVPTAITESARYVAEITVPSRAAENNISVIYTNHPASSPALEHEDFIGSSTVAGPAAARYAVLDDSARTTVVELPHVGLTDLMQAPYLEEMRPDLYQHWSATGRSHHTAP